MDTLSMGKRACIYDDTFRAEILFSRLKSLQNNVKNNLLCGIILTFFFKNLILKKILKRRGLMKKGLIGLAVAGLFLLVTSCSTTIPMAGATGTVGSKTGEASQTWIYYIPLAGEGGIAQAAQNGGISRVGTVDYRIDFPFSVFIPYYVTTTVVTGE